MTQYGDSGNLYEEARAQLPESIRNPLILVKYKNKKGNEFSLEKKY